jgi:hypothetical protein
VETYGALELDFGSIVGDLAAALVDSVTGSKTSATKNTTHASIDNRPVDEYFGNTKLLVKTLWALAMHSAGNAELAALSVQAMERQVSCIVFGLRIISVVLDSCS